jgi:hypothetical protein
MTLEHLHQLKRQGVRIACPASASDSARASRPALRLTKIDVLTSPPDFSLVAFPVPLDCLLGVRRDHDAISGKDSHSEVMRFLSESRLGFGWNGVGRGGGLSIDPATPLQWST